MKKFLLLIVVAVIAALGLAYATGGLAMGKNQFETEYVKEKEAVKMAREVIRGGYGIVTTDELKAWVDAGKDMLIIDTMPYESSYKKNHIPGAEQFLFPIKYMEHWTSAETDGKTEADFIEMLGSDKDRLIVIYCGFVKCGRSDNGAAWAKKLGYTNVVRHTGGIYAWKGAGLEVGTK